MEAITVNAEVVLYDVLHNIFHHLNIYDLNEAAKVCKSWYHSAKLEELKRGPQIMVLQALEDYVTRFSKIINKNDHGDDLNTSLRINPSVCLFFTDGKYPPSAPCDNVPYEICTGHQWNLPRHCFLIAIETIGIDVDNNPIGGEKNKTAVLIFPKLPIASVNYVISDISVRRIEQYFKDRNSVIDNYIGKLFSTDIHHTCFIMFIYQWSGEPTIEKYHGYFLSTLLEALKTKYHSGTYSLWGAVVNDVFTLAVDRKPIFETTSFYAMSISGPSIKSWSIVLSNNLSNLELKEKLQNFKQKVQLRSSSVALLILPSSQDNLDRSKVNIFRNTFATISLISLFNNKYYTVLSVNSTNNEANPIFKHVNSYAYMILTFNLQTYHM